MNSFRLSGLVASDDDRNYGWLWEYFVVSCRAREGKSTCRMRSEITVFSGAIYVLCVVVRHCCWCVPRITGPWRRLPLLLLWSNSKL